MVKLPEQVKRWFSTHIGYQVSLMDFTMIGFIHRSIEIIRNHGFRGYAHAIKRYFLWHPVIDEITWQLKLLSKAQSIIVRIINGNIMQVDSPFLGVRKYLYLYGCHEPECTKIFSQIIPLCGWEPI